MPSKETHGYYRKVIVPAIREHAGYITDAETHRALKAAFYEMHPDDPKLPSMADMSQSEAGRFIDFAIVTAAEMNLVLEDPLRGMGVDADVDTILAARRERAGGTATT